MGKDIITLIIIRSAQRIRTLSMKPGTFRLIIFLFFLVVFLLIITIVAGIYFFTDNMNLKNQLLSVNNSFETLNQDYQKYRDIQEKLESNDFILVSVDKTIPDTTITRIYSDDVLSVFFSEDKRNPYVNKELVDLNDLKVFLDSENDSLTVTFRLLNVEMKETISGFVIILADVNEVGEIYHSVFPERVNLNNGQINSPSEGDYFSITKFKFLNAPIRLHSGRLTSIKVYVYSLDGDLILFKPYYIRINR